MSEVSHVVVPAMFTGRVLALALRISTLPAIMNRCQLAPRRLDVDDVVDAMTSVERVWRLLPRGSGTCLTRSVWRAHAGRRAGLPLRFVIGVRMTSTKQIKAHAWLELDGALFMEAKPETPAGFTRMFEHPTTMTTTAPLLADLQFR